MRLGRVRVVVEGVFPLSWRLGLPALGLGELGLGEEASLDVEVARALSVASGVDDAP
jgi:hypothetical protein